MLWIFRGFYTSHLLERTNDGSGAKRGLNILARIPHTDLMEMMAEMGKIVRHQERKSHCLSCSDATRCV